MIKINRLRYYRERADMTQVELAKKTGLEQGRISRVEAGGVDFTGQQWLLIGEALDCTVDELLGRKREGEEKCGKGLLSY